MLTFKNALILILLFVFFWSCESNEPGVEYSQIKPRPPLVPNSTTIRLKQPLHLGIVTRNTPFDFTFNSRAVHHASLLIFTAEPSANNRGLKDVTGICLGGATSMISSHAWDNTSLHWDATAGLSDVYVCDGANRLEPLSTSTKVAFDVSLTAGTYYWAVLGYNKYYKITHSSALYTLTVN